VSRVGFHGILGVGNELKKVRFRPQSPIISDYSAGTLELSSTTRLTRFGLSFDENMSLGGIVEKASGKNRPSPLDLNQIIMARMRI